MELEQRVVASYSSRPEALRAAIVDLRAAIEKPRAWNARDRRVYSILQLQVTTWVGAGQLQAEGYPLSTQCL